MIEKQLTIINKLGLHARAAAKLVSTSSSFTSNIQIGKGDQWVNAKSIMGVMMLAASQGTALVIRAEGDDADEAVTALEELINKRFGEAE